MTRPLRLILFLSLSLATPLLFAQDSTLVEEEVYQDEEYEADEYLGSDPINSSDSIVNPRDTEAAAAYMNEEQSLKKFNDKDWKAIIGDQTYEEKPLEPEEKKEEAGEPWFKLPAIDPQILRLISFAVIFIVLATIVYFVFRNATFSESVRKMRPGDISAPVENIEEVDIDALLKAALAAGDLRAAIRVHYLMLLKKLNEVGLIAWKKDKTNRDYLSELYGRNDCYEDVRKLTLAYELVWYGERSVSPDSFRQIAGEFESVNRQVTKGGSQE